VTGEQEVIDDALRSVRSLVASSRETLTLIGQVPADEGAFASLTAVERVATTAALKQFEQLEGALNGLFRGILRALGVRLKGLYPLDVGHRIEELGIVDAAGDWLAAVKLRNELVHDYPDRPAERLVRLGAAIATFPFLFDAAQRAAAVVAARGLLKDPPA
jgi:hypothetical protein